MATRQRTEPITADDEARLAGAWDRLNARRQTCPCRGSESACADCRQAWQDVCDTFDAIYGADAAGW
jgi:hypothetical protein